MEGFTIVHSGIASNYKNATAIFNWMTAWQTVTSPYTEESQMSIRQLILTQHPSQYMKKLWHGNDVLQNKQIVIRRTFLKA